MLCFRCEHRARFLDDQSKKRKHCRRPRFECGEIETSKIACYMYEPTRPILMQKFPKNDPRPEHGGYFGSRMEGLKVLEPDEDNIILAVSRSDDGELSSLQWEVPNPIVKGEDDGER